MNTYEEFAAWHAETWPEYKVPAREDAESHGVNWHQRGYYYNYFYRSMADYGTN